MHNNLDDDLTIDGSSLLEAIRGTAIAEEESSSRWHPEPTDGSAVIVGRGRARLGRLAISLLLAVGAVGALIGFYSVTVLLSEAGNDMPPGVTEGYEEVRND